MPVRDAEQGLTDPTDTARAEAAQADGQTVAATRERPPSLWRNWDYMCWWSGNAVSLLGSNMSNVAFPLLAVFGTGSVLNAGIIAAAGRIGGLLTLLWGGALADRRSRKLILVVAPALQAAMMGVVTVSLLSGPVHVDLLAVMALLSGLVTGVRSGAVLPALRRIVPREQFAARAAQEQGLAMGAQLAGSPLAALLFGVARWLPFGVDALSFFFASIGAALIRHPLGPDREPKGSTATAGDAEDPPKRRRVIADIAEGFRIILRHDFLRYTTGWVAVTNLVGNSFMLLLVALLASRGATPQLIGVTNAGVLAGGILGAFLAGAILRRMSALHVFQTGGWVYVASLALAAVLPAPWQIGLATAAFTFASVPTVTVWESYTARLVPDQLIGRVGAASSFCAQSLTWLGMLLAGWLGSQFGTTVAALCFAGILLPFAVAGHLARSLTLLRTPLDQVNEVSVARTTEPATPGGRRHNRGEERAD
ncbi:Predicted arabinose efflux permease, MFS family [Micromonospora siamensis]|uniref:Predicted arabinose efflux permease, MFS family n=2 Tax=Micromonospora siamensis TaxID=299152 RepID=A0A1C5J7N1_9ACTN|nr:Predicted arabinose efflux permease, MFS family [Micromonospora siamensis]